MELSLFEEVGEILRTIIPEDLGPVHQRDHRYGIKVWFGSAAPTREHYEAQVIGKDAVKGARVLALEVGFHAEHPKLSDNERVIAQLGGAEKRWRRVIGPDAVVGPFIGRDTWRRISETWPDPDLSEPELPLELATRLADYITAFEPLLRAGVVDPPDKRRNKR